MQRAQSLAPSRRTRQYDHRPDSIPPREVATMSRPLPSETVVPMKCPKCGDPLQHVSRKARPGPMELYLCDAHGFFQVTPEFAEPVRMELDDWTNIWPQR